MSRKKNHEENVKSTVLSMRDEFDWGRILFDACYMFNYSLANYWREYVKNYNHEKICDEINKNINEMKNKRDSILDKKNELKNNKKNLSEKANKFYKKYIKTLPIGNIVKDYRKNNMSVEFQELIKSRKDAYNKYHFFIDKSTKAINEENDYIKSHLFQTRNLSIRTRSLKKIINIHELEFAVSIENDLDKLYNFLISEEQAEKLMGVCINILNTYSEKEFSTLLNVQDREKIAENIYNYFINFNHNYDFIAGCYEVREDNKLHLKDLEKLKNKLYNGYYFTIRGFVQCSYSTAINEKYNIESIDINWENEDENNLNKGVDKYISSSDFTENNENGGYSIIASSNEEFGEGMKSFWNLCQEYLINNADSMGTELYEKMKKNFPKMNYYSSMTDNHIMVELIINTIKGINEELIRGKKVSSKLKHIVLDSMGGAETKKEWRCCVFFISNIIMKHINEFFIKNDDKLYENNLLR